MEHAKEQERVHTALKYIEMLYDSSSSLSSYYLSETLSDDSSDSGTRQKLTKPVTLYNKSSTFPAKRKYDNEETPLKQPYQDAFISKQEILERIKSLHIKRGFLYTEHLFMLPINWLNHHKVSDVNMKIVQNFYNAYCTPKPFFVEKYFDGWDSIVHGPCNYLQSFYVAAFINKCGTTKHHPLEMFLNGIRKNTRSSVTENMDDVIPSSYSDSAMTPKKKKFAVLRLKSK